MATPIPTPIYRFMHLDNLQLCINSGGLHSPNHNPNNAYRTIHNVQVQNARHRTLIPCGPQGSAHDYVPFYFGYLSPMLLNLKTGHVAGYDEGQKPLIYVKTTAQAVQTHGTLFAYSDGHGLASFTSWYDDLKDLNNVDWGMVGQRYWSDSDADPDRQRRKQAEFLVHQYLIWDLIEEIGVYDDEIKQDVDAILAQLPANRIVPVNIKRAWYY